VLANGAEEVLKPKVDSEFVKIDAAILLNRGVSPAMRPWFLGKGPTVNSGVSQTTLKCGIFMLKYRTIY
jgi:hypothetical protein